MPPPAPGWLMITTCWFHTLPSLSASVRAVKSLALPAAESRMMRTGLSGQAGWASAEGPRMPAAAATTTSTNARKTATPRRFIIGSTPSGRRFDCSLAAPIRRVLLEELLRHRAVDQLHAVDRLGDLEVDAHAGDRVGFRRGDAALLLQQLDGLAHRRLHRRVEIEVEAERVVVRGIFRARPAHGGAGTLVQDELQRRGERLLERAAIDLAVALHAVRIAGVEQRAVVEHRQVERRADAEHAQVEV